MIDRPAKYMTLLVLGNTTKKELMEVLRALVIEDWVVKTVVIPGSCSLSTIFSSQATSEPGFEAFAEPIMQRLVWYNGFENIGYVMAPEFPTADNPCPPWDMILNQIPDQATRHVFAHTDTSGHALLRV